MGRQPLIALKILPTALILLFGMSVLGLVVSVHQQWVPAAGTLVVVSLVLASLAVVCAAISAVLCALNRFSGYWGGTYPVLLALMLISNGIFSAPVNAFLFVLMSGAFFVGGLVAHTLPMRFGRFVPLVSLMAFLVLGELGTFGGIRSIVLALCAGAIALLIYRSRKPNSGEV